MLKKIWFDDQPRTSLTTRYIQSPANLDVACMTKRPFNTLTVSLLQPEESILSGCTPNCRNEIRKGTKIGLVFSAGKPAPADGEFINNFLSAKTLGRFNRAYFADPQAIVCSASLNGTRMATHLYVASDKARRARLVYSAVADPASVSSFNDMSPQRLIGIANRFLHFSAIQHFKAQGLNVYDFGGIGSDESDAKIKGINEFKRSFGGNQAMEYNYTPIWISLIEKILQSRAAHLQRRQQRS